MADKNWEQLREIFDEALRQKPEERAGFIHQACGVDKTLFREIESLLASHDRAEGFLDQPAMAKVAEEILTENRQFSTGQMLTHYRIIQPLGAGGMGQVYLATDTKLNRQVALKVLHPKLLSDKRANRRLLREAQAAAMLDHPHICAIHEISESDDENFIIMQYVVGKTLSDLLAKERLGVETSLDLAIQIADALAEAHTHGIIHRDIKPPNIIVNEKWQAKVLDFGLAKIIEAEITQETTQSQNGSGPVMGTVPFMSPEQLRGKRLDVRTDIFSFGALFYEMLTGRQAFGRENNAETISSILNDEPDLTPIPSKLQPILRKSLMKNKDLRYQSGQDLVEDLRDLQKRGGFNEQPPAEAFSTSATKQVITNQPPSDKRKFHFWKSSDSNHENLLPFQEIGNKQTTKTKGVWFNLLIVLPVALVVGGAVFFYWQSIKTGDSRNFETLRSVRIVSWKSSAGSDYGDYRVSNNGQMVALSSTQDGKNEAIYIKQITDGGEAVRVTKDEWTNHSPIWSPDDQRIAFVSVREGVSGLYVCPSLGGAAVLLKIIGKGDISLRNWTKDKAAIFYEHDGNLFRHEVVSQETLAITNFAKSPSDGRHFDLSPDENQIVFMDDREGQLDLWTKPLAGGPAVRLTNNPEPETRPLWLPDGQQILYNAVRDNDWQIYLARTDGSVPVQVTRGDGDYELADITPDGAKVFYWFWRNNSDIFGVKIESGEEFVLASEIESEWWTDVSPDGKSIVYQTNESPHLTPNLWKSSLVIKSLENNSPPLVVKGYDPRWLPDSRRVCFLRWNKDEQKNQYFTVNAASGEEKQLLTEGVPAPSYGRLPINRHETGNNWSPDASHFAINDSKRKDVLTASGEDAETFNLTNNTNADLRFSVPNWSPDGKHIAYLSIEKAEKPKWSIWVTEQGKSNEIYSGTAELRLFGWSASGNEILLAMTDGLMKSSPLEIKILEVSLAGESRILTVFKNTYASSITLSADGKTLAFSARNDDRDNIWIWKIGAGHPKKLTANNQNRVFYGSPAWSADGKVIYFDKQDQINTISMFENF